MNARVLLTLIAGIGALAFGAAASFHRDFWIDEGVSASNALLLPWSDFLAGRSLEGNSAPLFFLLLKSLVLTQPLASRLGIDPILWVRLVAILPMAAFAAWMFRLAWFESAGTARSRAGFAFAAALFASLVGSYTFREYCWQARHYGLWALLSAIHAKLALDLALDPAKKSRLIPWLAISAALEWTTAHAVLQCAAAIPFLVFARRSLRGLGPVAIAALAPLPYLLFCQYNSGIRNYYSWPGLGVVYHLLIANARWTTVAGVLSLATFFYREDRAGARAILAFVACAAVAAAGIIALVWWSRAPSGYELPNRYWVFLFPQLTVALVLAARRWLPTQRKPALALAAGLSLLFAASGAKGLATMARSWAGETFSRRISRHIAPLDAASEGLCLCVEYRQGMQPGIHKWVNFLFFVRARNEAHASCETTARAARVSETGPTRWDLAFELRSLPRGFRKDTALCDADRAQSP